jgi:hypothetical protein
MVADRPPSTNAPLASRFRAKQEAPLVRCGCQSITGPASASLARSVPWKSGLFNAESAENLARPIGRNQTKARIALVSLGVGIGLDQPTVRGTANNAKHANHARAWPGRQT